jgi:hypothetical protein
MEYAQLLGSAERRMTMSHNLRYKRSMIRGCMKLPMLCLQGDIPLEAHADRLHTLTANLPIVSYEKGKRNGNHWSNVIPTRVFQRNG